MVSSIISIIERLSGPSCGEELVDRRGTFGRRTWRSGHRQSIARAPSTRKRIRNCRSALTTASDRTATVRCDEVAGPVAGSPTVKILRRALAALSLAVTIAGVLRLRGRGGTPPEHGGWKPVDVTTTPRQQD